ncbi:PPE domain-containing protein [Nocardia sp. NPDC023852]|uniref:PPE domain-containing protein n=1 Tax=Nocardia sp. NPDC023852 TaxID=3154697 RepID=UPI0033C65042
MVSLPFAFIALTPEENILRLTSGPGPSSLLDTAKAYSALAEALAGAASGTDGSMNSMAETYRGSSSDKAQGAFRNHSTWLREQSAVAAEAALLAATGAAAYSAAAAAMEGVAAWLAENRAQLGLILATPNVMTPLELAANQAEYGAIAAAAAAVMVGYAGATVSVLSALPPPIIPQPIVGGGPEVTATVIDRFSPQQDTSPIQSKTTAQNTTETGSKENTGDTGSDEGKSTTDPRESTSDPTQSGRETDQVPSDADRSLPSTDNSSTYSGADSAMGDNSFDQQGFYGTDPTSPTLAGLNGGMGSLVALGMIRGGAGSMPGASTGFRMPSNWSLGRGAAFGASSNPATTGPASRNTAPRGATAPKAQMRRRRRDENRDKSKVFVPGEPQDVPVLERPPIIGVIEYADDDRPDEVATDGPLLVGVLGRPDDDVAITDSEPPR